jgi:hypothetical protein
MVEGRIASGTAIESNAGAIAEAEKQARSWLRNYFDNADNE